MYGGRHNQVLDVLASADENQCQSKVPGPSKQGIVFVRKGEGAKQKPAWKVVPLVSSRNNWKMLADSHSPLVFPSQIAVSSILPDLVLWADSLKTDLLAELTVPWDSNMVWAYQRKIALYEDLKSQCVKTGGGHVYPVEVRCWVLLPWVPEVLSRHAFVRCRGRETSLWHPGVGFC